MLDQLVTDWDHWARTARAQRRLADWAGTHPPLAGWTMAELRDPVGSPRTDAMQAALVGLAQGGDSEALTTLVVQLRPGLIRLLRWIRAGTVRVEPAADTESDLLAALAETVLAHSLQRRPRLIAANLLLDTRQKIWRAQGRARRSREALALAAGAGASTSGPDDRPELRPDQAVGALDLLDDLAAALGNLAVTADSRRLTAEVAYRAWILDEASGTIATHVGLRPDAVRARLSRLRSALRASHVGESGWSSSTVRAAS